MLCLYGCLWKVRPAWNMHSIRFTNYWRCWADLKLLGIWQFTLSSLQLQLLLLNYEISCKISYRSPYISVIYCSTPRFWYAEFYTNPNLYWLPNFTLCFAPKLYNLLWSSWVNNNFRSYHQLTIEMLSVLTRLKRYILAEHLHLVCN